MDELQLAFSPSSASEAGSFRLLELPPEICKLAESTVGNLSLCIKGNANEDAVLCTSDKTYTIRSVVLSNSILVVGPAPEGNRVVIRDQRHEILELMPSVPKLHKLGGLLRGREYDEGHEDEDEIVSDDDGDDYELPVSVIYCFRTTLAYGSFSLKELLLMKTHSDRYKQVIMNLQEG
jgi:sister chromatid cohesion protein DCC1